MLQKLKEEVKQRILDSQVLQALICELMARKHVITVQRWVKRDDPILTLPAVLDLIRKHEGLPEDEVLTEDMEVHNVPAA